MGILTRRVLCLGQDPMEWSSLHGERAMANDDKPPKKKSSDVMGRGKTKLAEERPFDMWLQKQLHADVRRKSPPRPLPDDLVNLIEARRPARPKTTRSSSRNVKWRRPRGRRHYVFATPRSARPTRRELVLDTSIEICRPARHAVALAGSLCIGSDTGALIARGGPAPTPLRGELVLATDVIRGRRREAVAAAGIVGDDDLGAMLGGAGARGERHRSQNYATCN